METTAQTESRIFHKTTYIPDEGGWRVDWESLATGFRGHGRVYQDRGLINEWTDWGNGKYYHGRVEPFEEFSRRVHFNCDFDVEELDLSNLTDEDVEELLAFDFTVFLKGYTVPDNDSSDVT